METTQTSGLQDAVTAAANSAFGRWAKYPSEPVQSAAQNTQLTIGGNK